MSDSFTHSFYPIKVICTVTLLLSHFYSDRRIHVVESLILGFVPLKFKEAFDQSIFCSIELNLYSIFSFFHGPFTSTGITIWQGLESWTLDIMFFGVRSIIPFQSFALLKV